MALSLNMLSTEIGVKFSRSCIRHRVPLLRMSLLLTTPALDLGCRTKRLLRAEDVGPSLRRSLHSSSCVGLSSGFEGRLFSSLLRSLYSSGSYNATENPGYGVVSGSAEEDSLFRDRDGTKQLERRRLILYSKPGCCLCDALKEKLQLAFMMGGDNDLSDVDLEVRDITTNEGWERAYQYEIPVLSLLRADNSEEVIPRFSPRLTVEQLQKKLAAALHSRT